MFAATVSNQIILERLDFPTPHLERVMGLHRLNAKTLGFFPKGAFEEHAKLRRIIVALESDGECLGYLLYRIARGRATIVHLCVADAARGKGVARLLVDRLKQETKSLEGIGLFCRRDYDVTHIWSKFGFEAVHAKTGRGKDGAELTFWWISHGHEDLFSRVAEPDPIRQRVVIDANVFYDLHTRETPESEDSKALLADWVQASIELVVTKELRNEIAKGADEERRRLNRAEATRYVTLAAEDSTFQNLCAELRPRFPDFVTSRDEADIRQWAQHFFDAELGSQMLFGLREDLHLGVEGVYYRSTENNNLTVPGRVLWYVSKDTGDGSMTIKACSQLEEVVIGKPKELFRRFQRVGVYEWRDVYEAAGKDISNDIVAFRFRMTERFKNPVSMDALETLGIRGPFMSPRKISDSQFASIYTKGYALT
jgi:GNAT superfamily N-acetyltransferase